MDLLNVYSSLWLDGFVKRIGAYELSILLDGDLRSDCVRAIKQNGNFFAIRKFYNNAVLCIRLDKLCFYRGFDVLFASC